MPCCFCVKLDFLFFVQYGVWFSHIAAYRLFHNIRANNRQCCTFRFINFIIAVRTDKKYITILPYVSYHQDKM